MIPDAVAFVGRALVLRGALVESTAVGLEILLPPELAAHEGLDESILLVARPLGAEDPRTEGAIPCGLGTALLERHVAAARSGCPRGDVEVRGNARVGHARSLAERWVVRNGKVELRESGPATGLYLHATIAWIAEADDRFEGLVTLALDVTCGATPDDAFVTHVADAGEPRAEPYAIGAAAVARAAERLALRVPGAIDAALGPALAGVERRHARDHQRIASYFDALAVEATTARRRVDAAALATRLEQFARERDGKLAELRERYTPRVGVRIAAVQWIEAVRARVGVRIFRRKAHRDIDLHLPVGARRLDALACEGCGGASEAPAACDERLHLLCERCAPSAQGRVRCPACG